MAKIEKMFGAILKDQEQKSDELRDKIHAENKLKTGATHEFIC